MSAVPFGKSANAITQKTPSEILQPFFDELKSRGISVQKHSHGEEFDMFTISSPETMEDESEFKIFTRPDGVIEIQFSGYVDGVDDKIDYASVIGFGGYLDLEEELQRCGKAFFGDYTVQDIWDGCGIRITAQLMAQKFDPDSNMNLPSEQHAQWQQARSNRDGIAPDGTVIPHLG